MKQEIAGIGRRKPQLDIPINIIDLDKENPRIVPYITDGKRLTQLDLITILYEYFDTQVIAMSLTANGYFDEEPIIVIPENLPKEFKFSNFSDPDELANELDKIIKEGSTRFTVVEGNRRVATIKLLIDNDLREKVGVEKSYPLTNDSVTIDDISSIPCIIYENREQVSSYLGVRHIAGLLKWEAFAKAAYITETVEKEIKNGKEVIEAIIHVQSVVGDRSDSIRKQYITFKLFLEAKHDLSFDVNPIIENFSLLTVLYNSPGIRKYMDVESYSKVDFTKRIVPIESLPKFSDVLTWIFGNSQTGEKPVLTDSRKITNQLSFVVNYKEAIDYLKEYKDLDGAFERTNGEKEYLSKNLTKAFRVVQSSLQFAYKFKKDEELLLKVSELEELLAVLKNNLK